MSNNIQDLVDIPTLQRLLDHYCASVGMTVGIVDEEGHALIGSRGSGICAPFHQTNPKHCPHCHDEMCGATPLAEGEEFAIFRCRNGLNLAMAPIVIGGRLRAKVFCGQFLLAPLAPEFARAQAARYGFDEQAYQTALGQVPIVTESRIGSTLAFLSELAQTTIAAGMGRPCQAAHEQTLPFSMDHYFKIFMSSVNWIVVSRIQDGLCLDVNPAFEAFTGYSREEIIGNRPSDLIVLSDRSEIERVRTEVQAKGELLKREYIFRRKDGTQRVGLLSGRKLCIGREDCIVWTGEDITERKQAEEALTKECTFNAVVLDAVPAVILILDADGRIQRLSRFCEELSGYTSAEVLGRHVTDQLLTQTDELLDIQKVWEEQRRAGFPDTVTLPLKTKSDQIRLLTWSARVIQFDGGETQSVVLIGMDVTERARAAKALRQSERKYRELVENANCIIMRWDREGRITFMNEFGLAFFGYTDEELLGRHVMGTIVPETEASGRNLRPLMDQIIAAPQAFEHNVNENVRRDGSHVWIAWTNKVLTDETGTVVGILSIGQDITERKRMEEALREADRRKDEFLLMLSHELRNPLAPIRNAVEVLRLAGQNAVTQKRQQEIIDRQLKHFARLLDDLLDVARITRGEIRLHMDTVSLREVANQAVETAMILKGPRKDDFTCDFPARDIRVRGDLTRLVQVICNLLGNAIKYSHSGERILLRVTLDPSSAPDRRMDAVILVQDEGMGIDPEVLPHIFELFVQADKSLARTIGGLGVGLTLVRRIVDLHGGSIEASSAGPGQGSSIYVRLPVLVEEDATFESAGAEGIESETIDGGKAPRNRVLVVDDNADEASSLEELVNLWGYTAAVALTGPQALSAYAAFDPDIVLLDIGIPIMNGYEVAQTIRQQSGKDRPFLVAVTGYGSMEDRQQALASGFNAHLSKPVDLAQLHTLIGQYSGMANVKGT